MTDWRLEAQKAWDSKPWKEAAADSVADTREIYEKGKLDEEASVVSDVSVVPGPEWPKMDAAAYQGLAGEVVRAIEPHSEADPIAILIQFLTVAGQSHGPHRLLPSRS